jgi:hypothetical protein
METLRYSHEVKAHKEHRCNFCGEKIFKGTTYISSTHKCDVIYDWKSHKHCAMLASRLKMYDNCDEGVTQDDFIEYIHNAFDDIMIGKFTDEDRTKYSEVIEYARKAPFREKLHYLIRYFNKEDNHPSYLPF